MQGKLGWGFPCPELLRAGVVCVSCCDHGGPNSASSRSSQSVARPVSSDPSLPLTSCPVDRRKIPWAAPRMLWSLHLPPLFLWQCCSIQGSKASLSQGENYQCENLPWAKLAQPSCPPLCCPWAACIVSLSPSPSQSSGVPVASSAVLRRMHRWISHSAPTGQSWYFGSLGFLDHYSFVLMCCTMVCSGSHASQALWELVKCLFQNQSIPNLLYL